MASSAIRARAALLLQAGQVQESRGTGPDFTLAIASYTEAILQLEPLGLRACAGALGLSYMNRGNAREKLGDHAGAAGDYDRAIACFEAESPPGGDAGRNRLGAVWLNRGKALLCDCGHPGRREAALSSFDKAIALLAELPLGGDPSYAVNRGGAWLNRAAALLALEGPDCAEAAEAASRACECVTALELCHPVGAELSLKARQALCAIRSHELDRGLLPPSRISELGARVEESLHLALHWERRLPRRFRSLGASFYRLGSQLHLCYSPHLLADFLLRYLDPTRALGAPYEDPEWHEIASLSLSRARADNLNRRLACPVSPDSLRLGMEAAVLSSAETTLASLRRAAGLSNED